MKTMYYTSEEENYRKYGIVIIEVYDKALRTTIYHYRKPTPNERKKIILNYIIDNSGTPIKVNYLSSKLAVSDRTIQKTIKELAKEGLIKVEPSFVNGRQSGNKITYIAPRIKTGKELTLDILYDITNPYGFRDWDWEEFKLHPDLDIEERINQFEILEAHKEELRKRRERFLSK
jgi:DNA-binding Lrp family transcriptional regulator